MCGLDKNKLFTQNTIKTTKERVIAVVGGLFQGNIYALRIMILVLRSNDSIDYI